MEFYKYKRIITFTFLRTTAAYKQKIWSFQLTCLNRSFAACYESVAGLGLNIPDSTSTMRTRSLNIATPIPIRKYISEAQFVKKLTEKDIYAFNHFYDRYGGFLYEYVLNIVKDKSTADDIFQIILVGIWQKISEYNPLNGRLFPWMLNNARNILQECKNSSMKNCIYHGMLIPGNDSMRLSMLRRYDILDSPEEVAFDTIAKLASQIFDTPSAFITFVDKDRVFFKSNISQLPGREVMRKYSLCSRAILEEKRVYVIHDTHSIPELLKSPYVSCEHGIRFYASAALVTEEGFKLGSLCVIDEIPHDLVTERQLNILQTLADLIMSELEKRREAKRDRDLNKDLLNISVYE